MRYENASTLSRFHLFIRYWFYKKIRNIFYYSSRIRNRSNPKNTKTMTKFGPQIITQNKQL